MMKLQHIISLHLIIFTTQSTEWQCQKTLAAEWSGGLTGNFRLEGTYDLCDFVVGSETKDGWYAAYDNRTMGNVEQHSEDTNFTFYFNVAATIAKPTPDPECDNYNLTFRQHHDLELGYCDDIVSAGFNASCRNQKIIPINTRTAAYQAKKGKTNTDKCWRLHDGVTEPEWSFLSESDPALGIQLRYFNGDWCPTFGKNREFKMQFKCANDITITPAYIETVYEPVDGGCTYEFQMETYRGCPIECPVDNDQLCSAHGVCDYDWIRLRPKCFCYSGWYGADCADSTDPDLEVIYEDSDNSYVGALVVVILLLLVILFILGYLFLRYTRIKNRPFDFKFLQATKKRRAKKSGNDEYETE